jgi:GDP-4-dehydro-6-deoxy-D-mannose reductase
MRVLVTGASGFVGAHLAPLLRSAGHDVVTLSRDGEVDFRIDVTNAGAVQRAVREARPDGIIHLAAIAFVPDAERDAEGARAVNVHGTRNVLDAAHEIGARVVFASTGAVYGDGGAVGAAAPPFVEDAPLSPRGVYAETKVEAEMECLRVGSRQSVVRVRAFNHTGPGQAESYVCSGFAKQIAAAALGLGPSVMVVGDLGAERDFSDVRDIVRAYVLALERGEAGSVFNACSGWPTRIGALLDQLIAIGGVAMEVRSDATLLRRREASKLWGDKRKVSVALGWSPTIPLRQSLEDVLAWWRRRLAADAPAPESLDREPPRS